jgi:putative tricarboxylic transport membrane protein
MAKGELIFRGACVLFFAALMPHAWGLGGVRRFGEVGSSFWPLLVLALATGLSLFLFLQGLWGTPRDARPGGSPADVRRCLVAVVVVLGYLLIIPWGGFIATTPLFIVIFMLGLGERRIGLISVAPFVITICLYSFFIKFINIPLPRGSGIFLTFSRMLY